MKRWLTEADLEMLTAARSSHLRFRHLLTIGRRYALMLVREDREKPLDAAGKLAWHEAMQKVRRG